MVKDGRNIVQLELQAELHPSNTLGREIPAMLALFQQHFEGVSEGQFRSDLAQKHWTILIWQHQTLKGFTNLSLYTTTWNQEPIRILYSGDTITDPSIWSSPILAQAWSKTLRYLYQTDTIPLYWLLISSGYRTYRLLGLGFQQFYPCHDRPTPPPTQQLIHHLAQSQFQDCYDPAAGLVRFPQPQKLRPHLRDIAPDRLKDPHIAFFLQQNPHYAEGDELVCLAEVVETNLTRAGQRLWNNRLALQLSEAARLGLGLGG